MAEGRSISLASRTLLFLLRLFFVTDIVLGQIQYSIPEELEHGAFVGNIAEDLKLSIRRMVTRKFRLVTDETCKYFDVDLENGVLFVSEIIEREQICGHISTCVISFEVVMENPLEIYSVDVEVRDINDNSPTFVKDKIFVEIAESFAPGARFPLKGAQDLDVGSNSVSAYRISSNEYFSLNTQTRSDGSIVVELLLETSLDREKDSTFHLVLTAMDGGIPERSGTAEIIVTVLDANDNAPVFEHEKYEVSLFENVPQGFLVIQLKANDADEGTNAEVQYFFNTHTSQRVRQLFRLNAESGEIEVQGVLDFEESIVYEIEVQAADKGTLSLAGHTQVRVTLIDVNDNTPEIKVTSVSNAIPEDAALGTTIALISVTDRDTGDNERVDCQVLTGSPFKLQESLKNQYKLITNGILDREMVPLYNVTIIAWDAGTPPLYTNKTIVVLVTDINDNTPRFTQSLYTVYVKENNARGTSFFTVTALDPDFGQNSRVSYSILGNQYEDFSVPIYIDINSNDGNIYALRSFDYEQTKSFQIRVQATDNGIPKLSSSTTVTVTVLDENDNAPVIISPIMRNGSATLQKVPQSAFPGYLVTKIIASDADSGQNARLSFQLLGATDSSLVSLGPQSGEIKLARPLTDKDLSTQRLNILVQDNGEPKLSSKASLLFSIMSSANETFVESRDLLKKTEYFSDLNLYLIIILGTISLIFFVAIIILFVVKLRQGTHVRDYNSKFCCAGSNSLDNRNQRQSPGEYLNYLGENQTISVRNRQDYRMYLSPNAQGTDFLFIKPYDATLPCSEVKENTINTSTEHADEAITLNDRYRKGKQLNVRGQD
ncbi:protocadherin gamma-B1-like isoform X2 [Chiloscyllium punctatum]|uniref:protocadherin gamma-B1-like isoform X2 n=1 Tax=Chiloscyllium punctatum TaxID=137246 RepID=UPI003B63F28E